MGVQASTNPFVCLKDLLGDTTPRIKGVDHESGVKGGDSSTKDLDSEFLTTFWSFRGRPSVGNGLNTDIRWVLSAYSSQGSTVAGISIPANSVARRVARKRDQKTLRRGVYPTTCASASRSSSVTVLAFLRIKRTGEVYAVGTRGSSVEFLNAHDSRRFLGLRERGAVDRHQDRRDRSYNCCRNSLMILLGHKTTKVDIRSVDIIYISQDYPMRILEVLSSTRKVWSNRRQIYTLCFSGSYHGNGRHSKHRTLEHSIMSGSMGW